MPAVRTAQSRAPRACEACRLRKTRCYESGAGTRECLRCQTLNLHCSLRVSQAIGIPDVETAEQAHGHAPHNCNVLEQRVAVLEQTVERLGRIVEGPLPVAPSISQQNAGAREEHEAPLEVIRDAQERPIVGEGPADTNVIQKGIITAEESAALLSCFLQNYGRWIALPEDSAAAKYAKEIRKDPLLMCACALVAVRHIHAQDNADRATNLFAEAKRLLGTKMLQTPWDFYSFQAVLVLSLWPTTAGQRPLSLDAWLITGYALQQGIVSPVLRGLSFDGTPESLRKIHVWNHLCLSHMHACVGMRRPAMLSEAEVRRARDRLRTTDESNFEVRMVAELHLYWTIHRCCVAAPLKLPQAQASLNVWMEDWRFLFEQPRHHFLRLGHSFARLLIYEHALSNKSAAVRESLVVEMIHLCAEILQDAEKSTDDRTEHLTDHIYHVITFAAITMCRLLYKYSSQLNNKYQDAQDVQSLLHKTVHWLRSVGQACHIGRAMGDIIAKVHGGLFPDQGFTPAEEHTAVGDYYDGLDAPDMFGLDASFDWDSLLPDWQSLASENGAQSLGMELG